MPKATFDSDALYAALDSQREAKGLTWKKLAQACQVSPSTLTRMAQGRRPDVDSLAALLRWSGLDAATFIRPEAERVAGATAEPEPLAMISAYLRSDKHLTDESAKALDELIKAVYERMPKK